MWAITAISINMGKFPKAAIHTLQKCFCKVLHSPFFLAVKVCGLNLLQDAYIEQVGSSPHVNAVGGQTGSLYFYCKVKEVQ